MKSEAQRIAIAEACGWIFETKHTGSKTFCEIVIIYKLGARQGSYFPAKDVMGELDRAKVPDYLNDLNVMHTAEKELREPQVMAYILKLRDIVERVDDTGENGIDMTLVHCTASQRAEAFLRTLGKWTDDESEEKK